eukprot:s326_g27.t1
MTRSSSVAAPLLFIAAAAYVLSCCCSSAPSFVAPPKAAEAALQQQQQAAVVSATLAAASSMPAPAWAARASDEDDEGFDVRIIAVLALPLFAISWALFNVWRVAFHQVVRQGAKSCVATCAHCEGSYDCSTCATGAATTFGTTNRNDASSETRWTAEETLDRLSLRSLRMGAAGASCLAMQLRGKSLTRLDLSDNQLGDNSAAAIASNAGLKEIANSELQSNGTLEQLAIGEAPPGYSTVIKTARQRPNHISTEGLESLLAALSRNPNRRLAALAAGRIALRAEAGQALSAFLMEDSVLTSLDVSSNALTSEGISALLPRELIHGKLRELLQKADRLASLSIAHNVLEPRPMRRIARSISSCASLLSLNIAGTAIETEGVLALAETRQNCLQRKIDGLLNSHTTCLRELDMSENGISEAEALASLGKIIAGTALQTLRLNRNPLGNAGICQLADSLDADSCPPDGPVLRTLELGSCRIGRPGATFLLIRLRDNRRLLQLRLSDNFLDDSLDMTHVEALRYIQYLHLDSNRLSLRNLTRASRICAKNRFRELQARLRDVEAQLARRRAQHPKQLAEINEEISAALPKTEEFKSNQEEMRKELKKLQDSRTLWGFVYS